MIDEGVHTRCRSSETVSSPRMPDVLEVETWSLALPGGRRKAEALGVLEVPTIVVDGRERIVGVPENIAALKARLVGADR